MPGPITILAISGSLRAVSSNGAVLDAAALAAPDVIVTRFEDLAGIPAFNPIETLRTTSAEVVEAASIALPLLPNQRDRNAILADDTIRTRRQAAMDALLAVARGRRGLHGPGQPDAP